MTTVDYNTTINQKSLYIRGWRVFFRTVSYTFITRLQPDCSQTTACKFMSNFVEFVKILCSEDFGSLSIPFKISRSRVLWKKADDYNSATFAQEISLHNDGSGRLIFDQFVTSPATHHRSATNVFPIAF